MIDHEITCGVCGKTDMQKYPPKHWVCSDCEPLIGKTLCARCLVPIQDDTISQMCGSCYIGNGLDIAYGSTTEPTVWRN